MTGVDIIGGLLREDQTLLLTVPADRIKAGVLPEGVTLPALLVRHVSGTDRQTLKIGDFIHVTDRVSVTVIADNYAQQDDLIRAVRRICHGFTGDGFGARRIAVRTAGLGPDGRGDGGRFEKAQDFRVSFDAQA